MLNAFKQLIGLAPRDQNVVWENSMILVLEDGGGTLYSGPGAIEYHPLIQNFNVGVAALFTTEGAEPVMTFDINFVTLENPGAVAIWNASQAMGATLQGLDTLGRSVSILIGRAAEGFFLESQGLLSEAPVDTVIAAGAGLALGMAADEVLDDVDGMDVEDGPDFL